MAPTNDGVTGAGSMTPTAEGVSPGHGHPASVGRDRPRRPTRIERIGAVVIALVVVVSMVTKTANAVSTTDSRRAEGGSRAGSSTVPTIPASPTRWRASFLLTGASGSACGPPTAHRSTSR